MPFRKVGEDEYVSPSGRKFTKKQVAMYYATGGFKKWTVKAGKKRHLLTDARDKRGD